MNGRRLPAPRIRDHATDSEVDALESVLGVRFPTHLASVLLDPRGLAFQRLEWLGDSLLDGLLALRLLTRGEPLRRHSQLTSDAVLADRASSLGLLRLMDWDLGRARMADLVEACAAAAWLVSPADGAACGSRLLGVPLSLEPQGGAVPSGGECSALRRSAAAGAGLLEAAAALQAFEHPDRRDWDEGELSHERSRRLSGQRLLRIHPRGQRCGPPDHQVDHLQALVADVAVTDGLLASIDTGRDVLGALPSVRVVARSRPATRGPVLA